MKDKKEIVVSILALVMFTGITAWLTQSYINKKMDNDSALAATTTINAQIDAGNLSISAPGTATMTTIDMDTIPDAGTSSTGTIAGVRVKDHRAGAPGWSATATCSDFTSGSDSIAVTNLTVTPGAITPIGNSSLTGVTAGSTHTYTGTSDPASLMTATSGNGRGRYDQDEGLSLFVDVSTIPGTYTATVTETVA
ncbi:MAG: hypothetical protein ACOZAR_00740 [Patescibacteria group bacterium]